MTYRDVLVRLVLGAVAALHPGYAVAEVLDSSANGFLVKNVVRIAAPPAKVYEALVREVGLWWDPAHTFSGDARNLSIEGKAGGCFCERLPGGGGVRHLTVVFLDPRRKLRFTGALGPLQEAGVTGSLTWDLTASEGGTEAALVYSVGGYYQSGLQALASPVDSVLRS